MVTKKSEIQLFDLGLKDMEPGLNNSAFTHPGITGIGPNVLYGKVLKSYGFIKQSLNNKVVIPIFKNREGYLVSYSRDLVNDPDLNTIQIKKNITWVLENCRMSDKIRKIVYLILAEYLENVNDIESHKFYKYANSIRKMDPNIEGRLLLQLKVKKGFPFRITSDYIIENNEWVLTEWGIDHFDEVCKMLHLVKKELAKRENLFHELIWKPYFRNFHWGWSARSRKELFNKKNYHPGHHIIYSDIIKEAENRARIKAGISKIGQEKWKQEARLFEKIKDSFPEYIVKHHFRSSWLGRQHIDIFILDINVGIEFHGLQHFKPVDFFGGESSFNESQRRDNIKLKKCKKAGVKLFIVQEGYDFDELVANIEGISY